jgi:hypothetical protein
MMEAVAAAAEMAVDVDVDVLVLVLAAVEVVVLPAVHVGGCVLRFAPVSDVEKMKLQVHAKSGRTG